MCGEMCRTHLNISLQMSSPKYGQSKCTARRYTGNLVTLQINEGTTGVKECSVLCVMSRIKFIATLSLSSELVNWFESIRNQGLINNTRLSILISVKMSSQHRPLKTFNRIILSLSLYLLFHLTFATGYFRIFIHFRETI